MFFFFCLEREERCNIKTGFSTVNTFFFLPSGPKVPLSFPAPYRECCIFGLARQKNRIRTTRKKIPYEKLVKYLLKITRLLMKSGTNLYSTKFYNVL